MNHIYVRIDFRDSDNVSEAEAEHFVRLLADELEFRDYVNHHYNKRGWGIGQNLVVKVRRHWPARSAARARRSDEIEITNVSGAGVSFPDNPKLGRFQLRGRVTRGIKPALGRRALILMSYEGAKSIVQGLSQFIEQYPNTGTEVAESNDVD